MWAKVTSTKSFLQIVAAMEKFLMVTSKCILIQLGGGGIHLEDIGDLRVIQAARCSSYALLIFAATFFESRMRSGKLIGFEFSKCC